MVEVYLRHLSDLKVFFSLALQLLKEVLIIYLHFNQFNYFFLNVYIMNIDNSAQHKELRFKLISFIFKLQIKFHLKN
jgi:hypothetical protein